jgi:hypothetical protein
MKSKIIKKVTYVAENNPFQIEIASLMISQTIYQKILLHVINRSEKCNKVN